MASIWDGMQEFVAVSETGSFSAAARQLGVSVAHVSRAVQGLEDRLGARLLNRTTRKVAATEAGAIYYQHCRPLLDGVKDAERAVSSLQGKPQGILRLTAPVTYGDLKIMPLLTSLMASYPDMQVDMHLTNRSLDLVAEGLDMAIRLGALEDSSMIARKLAARRLFVCAAPAYIAARGQPHSLSELAQHHCLLGTLDYWRFQENGKNHTRKVHGRLRCNSGHALLHAALNGTGIVQLPDYYVADHLASGALVPMLTAFQPAEEGIWAIYPPSRHMSAKVRTTIDYLAQHLSTPVIPPKTTAACQFCTL